MQLQQKWNKYQLSADEPAQRATSWQTCCIHRWTLSAINLQPN